MLIGNKFIDSLNPNLKPCRNCKTPIIFLYQIFIFVNKILYFYKMRWVSLKQFQMKADQHTNQISFCSCSYIPVISRIPGCILINIKYFNIYQPNGHLSWVRLKPKALQKKCHSVLTEKQKWNSFLCLNFCLCFQFS